MFDALVAALEEKCGGLPDPHYLIGNILFEGEELDAVFIKPNAICVIEMKNYGGLIHFSENGPWFAGEVEVRGGAHGNPFRQTRSYRFTLLNYLSNRQAEILGAGRETNWGHLSCMVLFGQDITFDRTLPGTLGLWFHICDLARVPQKLLSLHSQLQLRPQDQRALLQVLELNDDHLYRRGLPAGSGVRIQSDRPHRFRIVHHKDSQFREAQYKMRLAAGARSQGVVRVLALFEQARRGVDSFASLPSRTDARIANCVVYTVNDHCDLVGIKTEDTFYPFFIGEPNQVESWIAANPGLVLTVDCSTHRIESTVVSPDEAEPQLHPPAPTTENVPFLRRVMGLDLASLVPAAYIRRGLERLDETSTDEDIREVLDSVPSEDARKFLLDVINLVRAGDLVGAEARIRLRSGEACPVADAASVESDVLSRGTSSDRVVVINDLNDKLWEQFFDAKHFQEWIFHLAWEQRRVAESNFERPVVLTGVSGSGKTCILVHRARYLARKYHGERIAVMTLNRTLADLLRNLVQQLCTDEERKNIHVMAFYDYFRELLHGLGPVRFLDQLLAIAPDNAHLKRVIQDVDRRNLANQVDARSGETVEHTWNDFFGQHNADVQIQLQKVTTYLEEYRIDASRYLREECTLVRSALTLTERDKYLDGEQFKREGRVIPFQRPIREDVLKILLLFEEWLLWGALLDVVELTQAVTPLWQEIRKLSPDRRFRCLLVDEFQDFSTLDLRLLLHVPTSQENGLFLAGDTVQKIMVKRLRLQDATLDAGNARHFEIQRNYRNSRQILRAASKLANHYGKLASAQGEEIKVLDPELALRETNPPVALKTDDAVRKAWEIAMECLRQGTISPWTVCIATATPEIKSVSSILAVKPEGLRAELLSGDCINQPETLVVAALQDLKGFEFSLVLLVGCEAGALPSPQVPADESWREALRLYVAMTRARDQVYLIYENQPSEFLSIMEAEVVHREEPAKSTQQVEALGGR